MISPRTLAEGNTELKETSCDFAVQFARADIYNAWTDRMNSSGFTPRKSGDEWTETEKMSETDRKRSTETFGNLLVKGQIEATSGNEGQNCTGGENLSTSDQKDNTGQNRGAEKSGDRDNAGECSSGTQQVHILHFIFSSQG